MLAVLNPGVPLAPLVSGKRFVLDSSCQALRDSGTDLGILLDNPALKAVLDLAIILAK